VIASSNPYFFALRCIALRVHMRIELQGMVAIAATCTYVFRKLVSGCDRFYISLLRASTDELTCSC
jgi:hypothetical protein